MENPTEHYWRLRLDRVKEALKNNHFDVYVADSGRKAKEMVEEEILIKTGANSISWAGSMTFISTGLYDALKDRSDLLVLDTFARDIPRDVILERRRQALLVDLFITGTNGITEAGQLVNLDMYGNRIGGITFGPKDVVVLAGRNKITADTEAAMARIKGHVAPLNAMRLAKKTPCVKTGRCQDCKSMDRICNSWVITEKSYPKGRVKVVLINEDLGL